MLEVSIINNFALLTSRHLPYQVLSSQPILWMRLLHLSLVRVNEIKERERERERERETERERERERDLHKDRYSG